MGLLNEINNVNRTLETTYKRELTKTEIKEKEKRKQKIIKKIMLEAFTSYFEGMKTLEDLQTLEQNFIKNKSKNIIVLAEYYTDETNEKATEIEIDFINENYMKYMIEAKKDIQTILQYEENKKTEEEKQKEKLKKELKQLEKELERKKELKYKELERERKEEKRQKEIQQKALNKEYIQKQKEKQIAFNNTIQALKTITLILLSPFLLIGFILMGIMKNLK